MIIRTVHDMMTHRPLQGGNGVLGHLIDILESRDVSAAGGIWASCGTDSGLSPTHDSSSAESGTEMKRSFSFIK